jgi:methylase of polypeptide subunit release factors
VYLRPGRRNAGSESAVQPSLLGDGFSVTAAPVALKVADKQSGRVFTPRPLVDSLCRWAVRSPGDRVLDLGVGEGAFALASFERLRELGADEAAAVSQVFGAERDPTVFERAQERMLERLGRILPHVVCADFYDTPLPNVDAVVGNPPYIRRHLQGDPARSRIAAQANGATGLTDAYCYFLLRACKALQPGGRLAVIVSASWLDMHYGQDLKRLLLAQFRLRALLGFDGQVFKDALVKPVIILAERKAHDGPVTFARLRQATPLDLLGDTLVQLAAGQSLPHAAVTRVPRAALAPSRPWSSYLKAPDAYADLMAALQLKPLREVSASRIGLQTFAKSFYVLTRVAAERYGVEPAYLAPLAFSPKDVRTPVITQGTQLRHVVFSCDQPEEALRGTGAARYIANGMRQLVRVRGKDEVVRGFHLAPRLARARRRPWYNVRTAIARRGAYDILLPRRVFERYLVVHNQAGVVANEDFIELRPLGGESIVAPLLAFLNSSFGEFIVRSHAFQYGGGVFNLNPGPVRDLPVIDPAQLSTRQRNQLVDVWTHFVEEFGADSARANLDTAVGEVLALSGGTRRRVSDALALLVGMAPAATHTH